MAVEMLCLGMIDEKHSCQCVSGNRHFRPQFKLSQTVENAVSKGCRERQNRLDEAGGQAPSDAQSTPRRNSLSGALVLYKFR